MLPPLLALFQTVALLLLPLSPVLLQLADCCSAAIATTLPPLFALFQILAESCFIVVASIACFVSDCCFTIALSSLLALF